MSKRINTAVWLDKYQRWQIKVRKDGQRKTFTSSTPGRKGQRECNKKADDWLDGVTIDPNIKVGKLWDKMVDELKQTTSEGHWSHYEQYGRNYVSKVIWHRKVASLREQDLQDVINYAYKNPVGKKPLSQRMLINIKSSLTSFLKYARRNSLTTLRPEFLRIPNDAPRPNKRTLQPEDIRKLFSSDKTVFRNKEVSEWYIHAYRFAAITGLRPGELYGLKRGSVDLKTGICKITGAINAYGKHTHGKNDNAIRSFDLPDLAMQEVRAQLAMLKSAGIISPYLFPEPDGNITRQVVARKRWVRYRQHNDIADISPYELRHTFFSTTKALPEELVKMIGGHSKDFDTFGTYGHSLDGESARAAQLVNSAFAEILSADD